jgi:hypothetical protein
VNDAAGEKWRELDGLLPDFAFFVMDAADFKFAPPICLTGPGESPHIFMVTSSWEGTAMPGDKADRETEQSGSGRWALMHLAVALLLVLALGAIRLRANLADTGGLILLAGVGVLALILAGLLFRSFLRR